MMFGVEFSDTVNLGAILIVAMGMGLALLFTVRSRSSATWKDNYEAEQAHTRRLEARLAEEREKKHEAVARAAALELTRDLTPVLNALKDLVERIVAMQEEGEARYGLALAGVKEMFADHEARAQERHEALLRVANQIAEKLNSGGK